MGAAAGATLGCTRRSAPRTSANPQRAGSGRRLPPGHPGGRRLRRRGARHPPMRGAGGHRGAAGIATLTWSSTLPGAWTDLPGGAAQARHSKGEVDNCSRTRDIEKTLYEPPDTVFKQCTRNNNGQTPWARQPPAQAAASEPMTTWVRRSPAPSYTLREKVRLAPRTTPASSTTTSSPTCSTRDQTPSGSPKSPVESLLRGHRASSAASPSRSRSAKRPSAFS